MMDENAADIVVVGSGPGGAVAAATLAEAGRDVLVLEDGPELSADSCAPFSIAEMRQKYRNAGLTVAAGSPRIQYVEGRVVGGGSEINSGLYHRTPEKVLESWGEEFGVRDCSPAHLRPHFEACEQELGLSRYPHDPPLAARKLQAGARACGIEVREIPRLFRCADSGAGGQRRSMSRTFLARARNAGARISSGIRVLGLSQEAGGWNLAAQSAQGEKIAFKAAHVFLSCGAIQTPAILRRSSLSAVAGTTLALHPTIKIVAEFPEPVNPGSWGVPSFQASDAGNGLLYGCSISSPAHLSVSLLDHPEHLPAVAERWKNMAVYYAMTEGPAIGRVRALPGFHDPLVSYSLPSYCIERLGQGLRSLAQILLHAGAQNLYPTVAGLGPWQNRQDIERIPAKLDPGALRLMTIHLFSSCRMGEDVKRCATGSFGEVHGQKNLRVCDASLLCSAPGVNPQGSIMALARRNALEFLGKL